MRSDTQRLGYVLGETIRRGAERRVRDPAPGAKHVAGAIEPTLLRVEAARARHKPTQDLAANDYCLRGLARLHEGIG